jgi:hypothetical protein
MTDGTVHPFTPGLRPVADRRHATRFARKPEPEEWRPAPGYEELYEVSSRGRVRNRGGRQGATAGYVLQPRCSQANGMEVGLSDGRQTWHPVAQLVATAFLGSRLPQEGLVHLDGDKLNNSVANLDYAPARVARAFSRLVQVNRCVNERYRALRTELDRALRTTRSGNATEARGGNND